ncbi:hypothetical protein BDW60DRAFT_202029 [Aspergillus nidulans var. acristatus]
MLINQLGPCRACMPSITSPYLHYFLHLHVKPTTSEQGAVIVVASSQHYTRVNQVQQPWPCYKLLQAAIPGTVH